MEREAKRILIIRLSALGDVAMTLPVVYSACRRYPDTQFYLLTRPFFAKICVNPPANLHIIEADLKGRHRGLVGLARLIKQLLDRDFDAVADLHNLPRTWVIDAVMRMAGKRVRMVDKGRRRRRADNRAGVRQRPYIDRYADVMAAIGYPAEPDMVSVFDGARAPAEIGRPAVGIAPFARYANKTYPPEMMEEVVRGLDAEGINTYLFGAKGPESAIVEGWADKYPLCTSVAGRMPIAEEMALMSRLDLMVSMDSANQHLAALCGTPVLTIWGGTSPICGFAPYRQAEDMSLIANVACQPCTTAGSDKCACGTFECLRRLEPLTIVQRIKRELGK